MNHVSPGLNARLLAGIAMAAVLAGCGGTEPAASTAVLQPAGETPATAPSGAMPQAPATEAAAATLPPANPSPARPAGAATTSPELAAMQVATATSKMGVPVDLRYQFDGDALSGEPVTLHLAAVPRVAGTSLQVSIKQEPGIEIAPEAIVEQKVTAATVYRKELSLRRQAGGPQELRVLVTMDAPIGRTFGYFTVPMAPAVPTEKNKSTRRFE